MGQTTMSYYGINTINPRMARLIKPAVFFICSLFVFMVSCAHYDIPANTSGPVYMEVSPNVVIADSGQVHTIWVTVLDGKRNPLQGVPVTAKSDTPNRISVTPENLHTDKEGKAIFTVNAISHIPGTAHAVFTANGLTAEVKTDFIYQ
ncbi:MAG: hypothetical protein GY800_01285 [Planctomycetes bacterium]|nr:hypothetical protein [Planctomycetota bacterium]